MAAKFFCDYCKKECDAIYDSLGMPRTPEGWVTSGIRPTRHTCSHYCTRKLSVHVRCKHFNGAQNETCKAGVVYSDVREGEGSEKMSLPCLPHINPLGATCDKCEFPTMEEIEAKRKEFAAAVDRVGTIRAAIVEQCGGPWKKGKPAVSGYLVCPCCKTGRVHFSRSGYNGHIHATCTTKGCASWME